MEYSASYFLPNEYLLEAKVESENNVTLKINGAPVPTNPFKVNIIAPKRVSGRGGDDLAWLANVFKVDIAGVQAVFDEIHRFPHAKVRNVRAIEEGSKRRIHFESDRVPHSRPLSGMSGGEVEMLLIEFAVAIARLCGRYAPTLLILDGFFYSYGDVWFDRYRHHFLAPENPFQTVLVAPFWSLDFKNIRWNGWQLILTTGSPPHCKLVSLVPT